MASVEDSNWRAEMTLLERQKFMYTEKYACDVTFVVGEEEEKIHAHQFVLVSASGVMEDILRKHKQTSETEIRVNGLSGAAFNHVMKYLYCEEVDLTDCNVLDILTAAEKYCIVPLAKKCTDYLKSSATVENVFSILEKSIELEKTSVIDKCISLISAHARHLLHSDEFRSLSKGALKLILQQDELEDVTEVEIFDLVMKWATEKCEQERIGTSKEEKRQVLGDLIYSIRFASMSASAFTKVMKKDRVLSAIERADFYEYIEDDGRDGDIKAPASFTSKPCRPVRRTSEEIMSVSPSSSQAELSDETQCQNPDQDSGKSLIMTISRTEKLAKFSWSCSSSKANAIDMEVNRNLKIHGVGLYGSKKPSQIDVQAKLMDGSGAILADTGRVQIACDGTSKPVHVMFPDSVSVVKHQAYSFLAFIDSSSTYCGIEGKQTINRNGLIFKFKSSTLDQSFNSVSHGQIPEILWSV